MSNLTEVAGVEYCVIHGGILIEGEVTCLYEESSYPYPCRGVPLFFDDVEWREDQR